MTRTSPSSPFPTVRPEDDRTRWLALYVLCAGMLMIVLDATIVNVALPAIQADLGFSQSSLAWVVNAYLISFGGLLLISGRLGDLFGRRRIFLIGLARVHRRIARAGWPDQGVLIAARFVQGVGGALTSAVILGMIVTMFPEPREQAKAIGVFASSPRGRLDRPARRRCAHRGAQLALDLLRQPPDRRRDALRPAAGPRARASAGEGADVLGAVLVTRADAGVYTIVAGGGARLGSMPDAGARRRSRSPCSSPSSSRRPPRATAHAATDVPQPQRGRRERHPGAHRRRHVRDVLPRRAVPAAGARLRRAGDRSGLPAVPSWSGRCRSGTPHASSRASAPATLLPGLALVVAGLAAVRPHAGRRAFVVDVLPAMLLLGAGMGSASRR